MWKMEALNVLYLSLRCLSQNNQMWRFRVNLGLSRLTNLVGLSCSTHQ